MTAEPSRPADARFQCAMAASERQEPLFATASTVTRWLLVEVPGAWGRNSVDDTALGDHVDREWVTGLKRRGVRILAVRRTVGARPDGRRPLTLRYLDTGQPGLRPPRTWERTVEGLDRVAAATAELATGDPAPLATGHPDVDPDDDAGWRPTDDTTVLICTNGRHDQCCAVQGRPVAKALRSSLWAPSVWESSHVGGDRFAANVVVLPDGLYFGRCTEDTVVPLLEGVAAGRLDAERYRGRSSRSWPEQAAEHFARTHFGLWGADDIGASTVVSRASGRMTVRLEVPGRGPVTVTVAVHEQRAPTPLTCRGPEGDDVLRWELVELQGG